MTADAVSVTLQYSGQWLPERAATANLGRTAKHKRRRPRLVHNASIHAELLDKPTSKQPKLTTLRAIRATIDSGCTGSMTHDVGSLINQRPCRELYRAATGAITKVACIGDLPVVAVASDGTHVRFLIRNVRGIPSYKYTLLSTTQMWKEQHISSRFDDVNSLVLTGTDGKEYFLPFDGSENLPTLQLLGTADSDTKQGPLKSIPEIISDLEPPVATVGQAKHALAALGFHSVGSPSHVGRLSAGQAAELLHRRCHMGIDKIRAAANTTADGTKNLASATTLCACASCAEARMKKAPHSGTLTAPAPEPGILHVDLKEMVLSKEGYRWVVFAIDEYTRYVFIEFIKSKADAADAVLRIRAAFDAIVATPVDAEGKALPRPRVREIHSDREGKLVSAYFKDLCASESLHHTTSPPHDHDLNPIAERTIGLISEVSTAIRIESSAPIGLWPWIISYAVDYHNSMITSAGSSTADVNITPHQRLTRRPPRIMDLHVFGCRAFALKPPNQQHKPSLSGRGWEGAFLGRARKSKGCYAVWTGGQVVESSSVQVDEEYLVWAEPDERKRPLTAASRAPREQLTESLGPDRTVTGGAASAPAAHELNLTHLSLFSGSYSRTSGLPSKLTGNGFKRVVSIDNDGEKGGGWEHDLLNDSTYAKLFADCASGKFDTMMVAFPCSTGSITRHFDASDGEHDYGAPIVRDAARPDGLPEDELDPSHVQELRNANLLLLRTCALIVACRNSSAKTTILFENPVDRSDESAPCYSEELKNHGSIFKTTAFRKLLAAVPMKKATFAYCRLDPDGNQKYTTIYYTPEAATGFEFLNGPEYRCNHPRGSHKSRAGGRDAGGNFTASAKSAAYPDELNRIIADGLLLARTGSATAAPAVSPQATAAPAAAATAPPPAAASVNWQGEPTAPSSLSSPAARGGGSAGDSAQAHFSPLPFPSLGSTSGSSSSPPAPKLATDGGVRARNSQALFDSNPNPGRAVRSSTRAANSGPLASQAPLSAIDETDEHFSPGGTSAGAYADFDPSSIGSNMEAAVADAIYSTLVDDQPGPGHELFPVTDWQAVPGADIGALRANSTRLPGGRRSISMDVILPEGEALSPALIAELIELGSSSSFTTGACLRADSAGAPATHAAAMRMDEDSGEPIWARSEKGEMGNHDRNGSWKLIERSELPRGRRVHKLIWVYKVKRDGTAKSRLCVQGTTLQAGVDYDQAFSAALRYSSARGLFAYAARHGCRVRSIDLVAAYLQGQFLEGESVYCHQAAGHVKLGADGQPLIARIEKPIYGIQQAGRRLQRVLFAWVKDEMGFVQLDDSDSCVFSKELPDGETIRIGIYVDNLQIVHSAELDGAGRGPVGCYYNTFVDALAARWEVVDEGPMEDLLGIEIEYFANGSIKLHQEKYIKKIVERFLPDGPLPNVQAKSMPYSEDFLSVISDALADTEPAKPGLVSAFQERVGCLMYAATSTRPDIAYAVSKLCQCLQKPSKALLHETDILLSYLSRHSSVGLTYGPKHAKLVGYADASWETRFSTSGWVVLWQSAALSWGSRRQKCVALSTCEAEIIALSEAAKDVVYLRKFISGLGDGADGDAADGPSELFTDSKSARDVSYNPEQHDRMKHVQRRHFYVRDMVESFELTVPHVPTENNIADFFTKPMKNWKQFSGFRRRVMNEPDSDSV